MNDRRNKFDATTEKRTAIREAEAKGQVADSLDVRGDLIARMEAGEFDLAECQQRLALIKRTAKHNGLKTRNQIWRES